MIFGRINLILSAGRCLRNADKIVRLTVVTALCPKRHLVEQHRREYAQR